MYIILFLTGEESGSQQLTSTFTKEFVEEHNNVLLYCIPWRTNGSRKSINCLLKKEFISYLCKDCSFHLRA